MSVKWSADDGTVPRDMQLWLDASQTTVDLTRCCVHFGHRGKEVNYWGEVRGADRISRQNLVLCSASWFDSGVK